MLAVVLAAGRGTRLGHLTTDRSKAMMPMAGQPMIGHVLDMLGEGGVEDVIVVAHPGDLELVTYLSRSSRSIRIQLTYQDERLGMAHALECASTLIRQMEAPEFLLASCDNVYPEGHVASLITYRREAELNAALTLMWTSREKAIASAVVVLEDGLVTDIIEKPDLEKMPRYDARGEALSAPSLYALSPQVLDYLPQVTQSPRGEREFPDALRLLIEHGGQVGGRTIGSRMTLTAHEDLLALNRRVLKSDPARAAVEARIPADVTVLPPVRIEAGASVGSGCRIGPNTYLEAGCYVGAKAVVRRSIVMRSGVVEPNRVVEDAVVSRGR
jgi:NDP-sugar pyrophosphorylase family protein